MNEVEETIAPGPGTLLAAARLRLGLPLAEISARTRIARHLLEALESENWSALPARVYVRGFIRLYSREVGIDSRVPLGMMDHQAEVRVEAEVRAQNEAEADVRRATWESVRWRAAYSLAIAFIVAVTLTALFSVSPPKLEARALNRPAEAQWLEPAPASVPVVTSQAAPADEPKPVP